MCTWPPSLLRQLTTSLAFMLPVATPPNAIAFATGRLRIRDMLRTGVIMNFIGVFAIWISICSYGVPIFGLAEYPEWADAMVALNGTATC